MNDGYIKLHRAILEWEWYDDPNTMRVFIHLLLNAQWEDSRYHGYEVPKGSLVIGRKKLAEELEITERAVRTALNHLKSTNEVTIKVTNRFSIVTIVNWAKYQGRDDENDQQNDQQNDQRVTNKRPATDHIKEYKNIRNKEIYIKVQNLYNELCPKLHKCKSITKNRVDLINNILDAFTDEEIKDLFNKANNNLWLTGENDRRWKADFDWLMNIDNFVRVQEGRYDSLSSGKNNQFKDFKQSNYDWDEINKELGIQ